MKIKVIVKEPFKQPQEKIIQDEISVFQKIVGGYVESVPAPFDYSIDVLCHEGGKIVRDKGNVLIPEYNDVFVGTLIFAGFGKNGQFNDLKDEQIQKINKYITCCQVKLGEDVYSNDLNKLLIRAKKKMQKDEMQ